ncbi:hypothetical protein FF38_03352 [Lucilia cuprina]|uniref:Uncharacterized protein n=1 Tax=Lucilia cuprina TaxID=7375 RepID=A0A0L0C3E8_LUCCU|nr:hypothetical protein FF38_03352 [Lucilia cuprina]
MNSLQIDKVSMHSKKGSRSHNNWISAQERPGSFSSPGKNIQLQQQQQIPYPRQLDLRNESILNRSKIVNSATAVSTGSFFPREEHTVTTKLLKQQQQRPFPRQLNILSGRTRFSIVNSALAVSTGNQQQKQCFPLITNHLVDFNTLVKIISSM